MAHLNCLPTRAAGVNYWFFLLAHLVVGVVIKQNAICKMLLRNIDGKMNLQNCGFSTKWRHALRLTATAVITDSRHRFSKRWHVANVRNIAGDGQTTIMVHQNSANIACTFRFYVCLRLRDRDCCSAADGSGSCHAPAPSYFEEMKLCRCQKLHWSWPGNPNGRSNFRNLGLFTFTRSELTLRRRLRGWWRLPEIAQTARNRRKKHCRDDKDRPKFHKYENLCLRKQAKCLEKFLFAATNDAAIDGIAHCFFPAITRNGFCSNIRKIISRRPWPPRKNRDIHIVGFCRFYL